MIDLRDFNSNKHQSEPYEIDDIDSNLDQNEEINEVEILDQTIGKYKAKPSSNKKKPLKENI